MRVGIVGGGQLAQMMATAGRPLGLSFTFLDPNPDACAFSFGMPIVGRYDDRDMLLLLASQSDVVTFEFENVPADSITYLQSLVPVYPSPEVLRMTQDRLLEKQIFHTLDIETVRFLAVNSLDDLILAISQLGLPLVLKTRGQGYDGKGQSIIRESQEASTAFSSFNGVPLIAEAMAPYSREISVLGVRSHRGATRFYDLSVNVHRDGILHSAMASPDDPVTLHAQSYLSRLMTYFDYVGVMTLELFECPDGLVANEYAPRVHNSGHWTIEGTMCNQFENHLRAICGLALGDSTTIGFPAIVNCIGQMPDLALLSNYPHLKLHSYHKESRPGRKVGHIFIEAESLSLRDRGLRHALTISGVSA